jgi:hypothetical protein
MYRCIVIRWYDKLSCFLNAFGVLGSGVLIGEFWGILDAGPEKHLLFSFFPILHACRNGAKETMQWYKNKGRLARFVQASLPIHLSSISLELAPGRLELSIGSKNLFEGIPELWCCTLVRAVGKMEDYLAISLSILGWINGGNVHSSTQSS